MIGTVLIELGDFEERSPLLLCVYCTPEQQGREGITRITHSESVFVRSKQPRGTETRESRFEKLLVEQRISLGMDSTKIQNANQLLGLCAHVSYVRVILMTWLLL